EFHQLVQRFNRTLYKLKDLIAQLYEQRLLTQQAEMKQLQAQINPHFLYNNFYILDSMLAIGDYENASVFLKNLGDYFKYVTQSDQTNAYLSEELAHARTYLAIQAMRFGKSLAVCFPPLPPDLSNPMVPKIILQPIVENAFKHAFDQSDADKMLSISVAQSQASIQITVENSGNPISPEAVEAMRASLELPADQRASTGLANVHKRLLISHNHGLTLSARAEGGLCVSIL
ncbi:MAG TPA: histidine kinase, partial [Clostridia bacterium]|nr:histidine kinase [Clostridia bacterium]